MYRPPVPTVQDVVRRLLPAGTGFAELGDVASCPVWPPDVFAVVATLVEASGCYAEPRYSGRRGPGTLFGKKYLARVRAGAARWRRDVRPPRVARDAWGELARSTAALSDRRPDAMRWKDAAMELLALADEACAGIGFTPPAGSYAFADYAIEAHRQYLATGVSGLPHIPSSLCIMVPPSEACVLPKTRTAQVGCTLRTLSHNLALLPPRSRVVARWQTSLSSERQGGPLRLLLVPFPYRIAAEAFVAGKRLHDESASAHFTLRQEWLRRMGARRTAVDELVAFVRSLMREARDAVGPVGGVVFPEGSLDERSARELSRRLAGAGLEFFIAGVTSPPEGPRGAPRNQAYASLYFRKDVLEWWQSKHHRWCLDRSQIERYGLEGRLSPRDWRWWEDIDISRREVNFYVFRPGASIAVLVCEDLARVDPVQPVVRAVGPTLVVALLLDGAQSERRWPARYATVLADDPGSAVLTLTSLGMVRRSMEPGESRSMPVALWKDSAAGGARELALPHGSHGLVLELRCVPEENWTLDGRSDHEATVRLELARVAEVTHPRPPAWV
jgi:hypothetical protein